LAHSEAVFRPSNEEDQAMMRVDKWTRTACSVLLLSAFLACKKKSDEPAPAASASLAAEQAAALASAAVAQAAVAAAASAAAAAAAAATPPVAVVDAGPAAPVLGAVKRFADKEKAATGTVKIALDDSKIYDEPDNTKPSVASLTKDLAVVRLATLGTDWTLVEFPSGIGKVSPGWIETKSLVGGVIAAKPTTSATPAASASAKPAASAAATATATAAASASAAPRVRIKPGGISRPGGS
jgi:hypothetical protein